MRLPLIALVLAVGVLSLGPAQAQQQQQQQQPSAGGTPAQMRFNIPYGNDITLERAKQLVAAAEAEGTKRGWKMNIAVVDTHGDTVTFLRLGGGQHRSI